MISVVPEEEGEDINMESYGEEGYEQEYEGEYTDTEGEEAPPEYTTADEGYQGGEGDNNGLHQGPPPQSSFEDPMETTEPTGQLVVREPGPWGESQHGYPQLLMANQIPPSRKFGEFQPVGYPRF